MPSRFDRRWLSLKRATASIPFLEATSCAEPPTTASVAIPPLPPQRPGLPGDLIEVVRQSSDHMHEPKVGKICSKA